MIARIDVIAPATICIVDGATVSSSLLALPPYGISVTDPGSGPLSLTLVAANAGAVLSASAAGGAGVVENGNTLGLAGTAAEVNAALASLQLLEPSGAASDLLSLNIGGAGALAASTDIAVQITPAGIAAFANPPASLDVQPNALTVLPGLILGFPAATALAAAGQGRNEALQLVLNVGTGILLLPGLGPSSFIVAAGQGTGTVSLSFTADQLIAVNAALAGLTYAGSGGTQLSYALSTRGVLAPAATSGHVNLVAQGSAGANGTYASGGDIVILGGGTGVLKVAGLTADIGSLNGSIFVAPAGTLAMPGGLLSLSGTSEDFGLATVGVLDVTGADLLAQGESVGGGISIADGGLLDFGGTLIAGGNASLAAGGVLTGSGALVAGKIAGPGTLLAANGDTLQVLAGDIGGASLVAAGGGVLELGAAGSSALTLDSSAVLDFAPGYGTQPITGGLADHLAQDGSVIVLDDPQNFPGTIEGFAPGDRLVLPGLSDLSLSTVAAGAFEVTGTGSSGQLEQFTLHATIPAGATLTSGQDAAGDAEIGLSAGNEVFIGGSSFSSAQIDASAGVGQTLLGLQLLAPGWTSQALTLTLSVADGVLAYGAVTPSSALVLTAASPAALNAMLSGLVYTANLQAGGDTLTASSNTGILAGLDSAVPITIDAGGTVSSFSTVPTDEQTVLFAGSAPASELVTAPAAPGAVDVSGTADFADALAIGGIGGTALSIDGNAVFDAGSDVTLAANASIGGAGGAGTLGIVTPDFMIGSATQNADLVVGGNSAAAGSAVEITGALTDMGDIVLGQQAAARLDLSGTLSAIETTIGASGTLTASGSAAAAFGDLADSGTLALRDQAQGTAQQLVLSGQLALGGGTALSGLSSAVIANGGALILASGASLSASGLNELGGSVLDAGALQIAGNLVADSAITLAGGLAAAAAATIASGAVLSGYGDVVAVSRIALTGGEILASGGLLTLDGDVTMSNGGSIVIAGGSALDLMRGAAGGAISFAGTAAVLTVNDLSFDSSAVTGMLAGDVIDLVGVPPAQLSDVDGTIAATDGSGNFLGSFALSTAKAQPAVTFVSDNEGGALITLGGEMACFARGTRLLTPNGYVPVEDFKPGDPIITRLGIRRAVRWIGRRNMELGLQARQDARPILVLPGAMGPGMPSRQVRLSPSHAVLIDGVLVPVMHLVNGATVLREPKRGTVTYFHIELDRHDLLMAEGLPVESYLDSNNRGEFTHEQGIRGNNRKSCAPLVTGGARLARIRRRLHEITLAAGFVLEHKPRLQAVLGDDLLEPRLSISGAMHLAGFELPRNAERLLLLAPTAAPAETDPNSGDRRELAVCLRQPRAKPQRLRLGSGWYAQAPGDAGIWMSGSGEVFLPPHRGELTLRLTAVAQSWRRAAPG